jgi:N-acetylglutamate synthase-like GNAT family acetyltransferase
MDVRAQEGGYGGDLSRVDAELRVPLETSTRVWVATRGEEVIGVAGVRAQAGERRWRLSACWVAPEARGEGVGDRLVHARMAWLRAQGAREVDVFAARPALFERLGFERQRAYPRCWRLRWRATT